MKKRIVVASMLFSVCTGSYAQMTPEQMQQIMMLQQVLQMKGGSGGMPNFGGMSQQQMPALQPSIVITEEALAKKVMELGSSMGSIAVEKYRDGFSIDKIRFVDAEGGIIKYAYDALTGDVRNL
jgi:hypothetical protein